jgi:hypothetical protein
MTTRILDIRPAPPGAGNLRARFDVELPDGIRLFNLALKQTPSGWRVFAPSAFGSATATFTREQAAQLIAAAHIALGETHQHDRSSRN